MTIAGVALTNPDRVLYPEQGITKRELASYYEKVAAAMVPHVAHRPLVLVRCPAGRRKTCFYQKHWTGTLPAGVETVAVAEGTGPRNPYAVIEDATGLVGLVQYGALEFHVWGARADRLEAPDRVVFDLDPGPGVPWAWTAQAARDLRGLLGGLDLESWLKTSGGKGLHVVVPIERRVSWEVVARFAEAAAKGLARTDPDRYVTVASKKLRAKRIFIDWLRNSRGALVVAPWSTRSREGAPVSRPIRWDQLDQLDSGDQFAVPDVLRAIRAGFNDPWVDLPRARQRLTALALRGLVR